MTIVKRWLHLLSGLLRCTATKAVIKVAKYNRLDILRLLHHWKPFTPEEVRICIHYAVYHRNLPMYRWIRTHQHLCWPWVAYELQSPYVPIVRYLVRRGYYTLCSRHIAEAWENDHFEFFQWLIRKGYTAEPKVFYNATRYGDWKYIRLLIAHNVEIMYHSSIFENTYPAIRSFVFFKRSPRKRSRPLTGLYTALEDATNAL